MDELKSRVDTEPGSLWDTVGVRSDKDEPVAIREERIAETQVPSIIWKHAKSELSDEYDWQEFKKKIHLKNHTIRRWSRGDAEWETMLERIEECL